MAVVGSYDSMEAAVAAGAQDIRSQLFNETYGNGYEVGFGDTLFTVFAEGEIFHLQYTLVNGTGEAEENDNVHLNFNGLSLVDGRTLYYHKVQDSNDSYYDNGFLTFLVSDETASLSEVVPSFLVRGIDAPKVYASVAGGAAVEQESGVSVVDFSRGPVQYTVSSTTGKVSKNYWVTVAKKTTSGADLFVNGINGPDGAKREVFFNSYAGQHHDIFFSNIGSEVLTGLKAELSATNVKLDDYWTVGGEKNDTLAAFTTTYYDENDNIGKIRLLPDGEGKIEGTLTLSADGQEPVVITLTGAAGDPKITSTEIPNGVKYVPYGTMIQTNNMYDWNVPVFSVTSGKLPEGMVLKPNGEIYGVPKEEGTFEFRVQMKNSNDRYHFSYSYATLTLEVKENTNENVDASTDQGYTIQVRLPDQMDSYTDREFKIEGVLNEFRDLWLDGNKLVKGVDYISEEGSTKITIYSQTFRAAGRNTHTIAAEFRVDGDVEKELKKAAQNFRIGSNSSSSGDDDDHSSSGSGSGSGSSGGTGTGSTNVINGNIVSVQPPKDAIVYQVRPGDTLGQIALNYYGAFWHYKALYAANAAAFQQTNGVLLAGMTLILPNQLNGVARFPVPVQASGETLYTVKAGDTLSAIAASVYGDATQYTAIFQRNRDRMTDPDLIYEGQILVLPDKSTLSQQTTTRAAVAGAYAYTVQEGDTLRSIAREILQDEKKWKALYQENRKIIKDADVIYPGQILSIPAK